MDLRATSYGEANGDRYENEVHERVRHGYEFLGKRQSRVDDIGRYQEYPREAADPNSDNQRVDQACSVTAGIAVADQENDPGDQERIDRQIEEVTDRRERRIGAKESGIVVGEQVAGHEEELPGGNQQPRQSMARSVVSRRTYEDNCPGQTDEVEDGAQSQARNSQEHRQHSGTGKHVYEPDLPAHHRPPTETSIREMAGKDSALRCLKRAQTGGTALRRRGT